MMHSTDKDHEWTAPKEWKAPLITIIKITIAFSTLTFFVGYFFYHRPEHWLLSASILLAAYGLCIVMGVRHLIKALPIPVLMLLVPIAPLFILIYVVSLIAFLQRFT